MDFINSIKKIIKALAFPFWLEKGVYNMMALQQFEHQKVLELCCGDGLLHTILLYLADLVYAC